jgi:hypothetical protein
MQLTRMFELSTSAAPPKRSLLSRLDTSCLLLGLIFIFFGPSNSPIWPLFFIASSILSIVDARQKKGVGLPSLSPTQKI